MSNDLLKKFKSMAESTVVNTGTWREDPVSFREFFTSEQFLNETPFPGKQEEFIDVIDALIQYKVVGNDSACPDILKSVTEVVTLFGKGCKHGSTKIIDQETGLTHTFEELYHSQKKPIVAGFNPPTLSFLPKESSEVVRVDKGTLFKITTEIGRETIVFGEHRFYGKGDFGESVWTRASELNIGSSICVARDQGVRNGITLTDDEIQLSCQAVINDYDDVRAKYEDNEVRKCRDRYGIKDNRLPNEFLNLDEKGTLTALHHLFLRFGEVVLNPTNPNVGVRFIAEDKGLLKDIDTLLQRAGILASFHKVDFKTFKLEMVETIDIIRLLVKLRIKNLDALREYYEVDEVLSSHLEYSTDVYYDKVANIEYYGEDYYYDLTVPEYGSYVSDGFIDHNSGKDFLASCALTYMAYVLLCLNNPHEHLGLAKGSRIDLVNMATNAYQANNVFFKEFQAKLANCTWFNRVYENPSNSAFPGPTDYQITEKAIRFPHNITAHSAHSEAGSYEGFNPLMVIFDEIDGFRPEVADFAYETLNSSAKTRFNDRILMVFISFPRSGDGFMLGKVEEGKTNDEIFVLEGKSWEVNPTINRASLQPHYDRDPIQAKMYYECVPPKHSGALFTFPEKIDEVIRVGEASSSPNLIVESKIFMRELHDGTQVYYTGLELHNLQLDPTFTYYLGGDGGIKNDSYVLCLMHGVPTLVDVNVDGEIVQQWVNMPVEDLLLEWRPDPKEGLPVDLLNVSDIISQICNQVTVRKALFDKFNSADVVQRLISYGVDAEDKNFSNPFQVKIYQNLKNLIYSRNISLLDHEHMIPGDERLNANDELKAIQLLNSGTKIDHPRTGAKDLSDARASAAYICSNDDPQDTAYFAMPVIKGANI